MKRKKGSTVTFKENVTLPFGTSQVPVTIKKGTSGTIIEEALDSSPIYPIWSVNIPLNDNISIELPIHNTSLEQ